ncbi:MAG: YfiT family bacillithiol transferase [Niabella sp.]
MEIENQYPIGKMELVEFSPEVKERFLADIKFLPNALEAALLNLNEDQLHTPYREGGWTVHQLVHHIADSHMNACERFKLGYTEKIPTIKPYNEAAWAELADVKELPVNISVTLLFALHTRWYTFLKSLQDADWQLKVFHPEYKKELTLWYYLQVYAWHSRHHVAQINYLREKMKW